MSNQPETESGSVDKPDTPDLFLKSLATALRQKAGFDAGLASILATHLLIAAPAGDAVTQAKDAILKLASTRAASVPSEVVDD